MTEDQKQYQSDPGETAGFKHDKAPPGNFICDICGGDRFFNTFKLGPPAGFMYERKHCCHKCGKEYELAVVSSAIMGSNVA